MTKEIFDCNKFKPINENEYDLYNKKLDNNVFNYLYKKGSSKKLKKVYANENINEYNIEKEEIEFIGYEILEEEKERLLIYFDKDLINEKLSNNNEYFKGVLEQIESINKIIEPVFKELEVDYEIHLTGGALRDHVLHKTEEVKDLDILIEFSDKFYIDKMRGGNGQEKRINQKLEIDKFFKEKEQIIKKYKLNINSNQSREKILHEIIFQMIEKNKEIDVKSFLLWGNDNNKQEETKKEELKKEITDDDSLVYDGLFSVIKINGKNFKYPMDLLLNSNKYSYLNFFDFNICKCLYTIKKLDSNKDEDLYIYEGFIKDVMEKKLSLNAKIFYNEKQIDRCFKDHYIRLKKKYSEYQINILEENVQENLMPYIMKSHVYYLMESRLEPKGNTDKIKRRKI